MPNERGQPPANVESGVVKRTLRAARDGVIGNLAWALLVIVAVIAAPFLKGKVPTALFLVALVLGVAFGGFVAATANRRATRLEAERNEARNRLDEAIVELARRREEAAAELARYQAEAADRLSRARGESEQTIRALREQVASATGGQAPISMRWQSLIRQLAALRDGLGSSDVPGQEQRNLLVAVADDFNRQAGGDDAVAAGVATRWREGGELSRSAFLASAQVLQARAEGIGTQEALAAPQDWE